VESRDLSQPPGGSRRLSSGHFSLTKPIRSVRPDRNLRLTLKQKKNKIDTNPIQEGLMTDLFQDVLSLVSMSTFLITVSLWIGAL
jgi:hypothetical protein